MRIANSEIIDADRSGFVSEIATISGQKPSILGPLTPKNETKGIFMAI
jgi:hypothetical protein